MPASLFTKEKTAFVGLGWSNIVTTLPPQSKEEEKAFLSTLLQELNSEFALQLDISPKVDRQLHTPEVSSSRTIIVGGGSHASRLATSIGSIYPEVVDLTIGRWRLTEKSGENLAYDIENVLDEVDPANTTIILHLFDNSVFMGETSGTTAAAVKTTSWAVTWWPTPSKSRSCLTQPCQSSEQPGGQSSSSLALCRATW